MSISASSLDPSQKAALDNLIELNLQVARSIVLDSNAPRLVISPYRFNPLGAHIDHQGGSVLARSLNQYTLLYFWPRADNTCRVHANPDDSQWLSASFQPGELDDDHGWDSMARAALTALSASHRLTVGMEAVVVGTLVSGGLSSSASVILAYVRALAELNDICLSPTELVELVRVVENEYRGLNNGIQDQMSIVFGQLNHLVLLDVTSVSARAIADPDTIDAVEFLMCYSGVSRNLVGGSNFNVRVAECAEAAGQLAPGARHLGDVPQAQRTESAIAGLPALSQRRVRHVFSEMQRVKEGCVAWQSGQWQRFGELMNDSCHSSINHYESGSPWLIDLHVMASTIEGVYGSRFSGGGYGGCLFMLVDAAQSQQIGKTLLERYLDKYPELTSLARVCRALPESTVRVVTP